LKLIKRILLAIVILVLIGFVIIFDIADRDRFYSKYTPTEEFTEFYFHKSPEHRKKAFEKNFGVEKYKFPREKTEKIKLFKNSFLISHITSKTVSDLSKSELIDFFNNPKNFNWGETTWRLSESEYILRFYNKDDEVIGKIWICIDGCGMTESEPFSPNMKYGGLSELGKQNINAILKQYK
jgi:hypothetical protein